MLIYMKFVENNCNSPQTIASHTPSFCVLFSTFITSMTKKIDCIHTYVMCHMLHKGKNYNPQSNTVAGVENLDMAPRTLVTLGTC